MSHEIVTMWQQLRQRRRRRRDQNRKYRFIQKLSPPQTHKTQNAKVLKEGARKLY